MASIPIQNIYFMFCYAWKYFQAGKDSFVGSEDCPSLLDLLAKVFVKETSNLVRRGLDREYVEENEDLAFPKGKILMGESVKRNLLYMKRLHCSYDELSANILVNQIIKTCLYHLILSRGLDLSFKEQAKKLFYRFEGVDIIHLDGRTFCSIRLHRNNAHYRLLLKICELLSQRLLPDEIGQEYRFRAVDHDQVKMGDVFEEFVRNFYAHEQTFYRVKREKIYWNLTRPQESALQYLPEMNTDISLISPKRKIIIDTKFYKNTLSQDGRFAEAQNKIHSANLYQMFSYLKNTEHAEGWDVPVEGILLYPTVDQDVDFEYEIQGHRIRIVSLNLNQPWQNIKDELLSLIF